MPTTAPVAANVAGAVSRRHLLQFAVSRGALPLLAAPFLVACGDLSLRPQQTPRGSGAQDAALLLPLSGELSGIGQNMERAASLVTSGFPAGAAPAVLDCGDSPETAAAAARTAIAAGAKVLFGPLRAEQTTAVLSVAGNVPVVTFSNDDTLAAQGAFVMGLTPAQSVGTMLSYARAQGLTRVAILSADTPFGRASIDAANLIAPAGGITLSAALLRAPEQGGHVDALRSASGGTLPQAVYIPDSGARLAALAKGFRAADVQLLGSVQWSAANAAVNGDLDGAWFAAPSPDLYQPFQDRFFDSFNTDAGVVAALGHDAALIAGGLADIRSLNRKGLTRAAGFTGVLGPFRFSADGRCIRSLAVLSLAGGQTQVVAEVEGT